MSDEEAVAHIIDYAAFTAPAAHDPEMEQRRQRALSKAREIIAALRKRSGWVVPPAGGTAS